MEKFGILVSFPASIMFTVEAESQEAAEEIIKNIVDEFNPDDVKLEYDANLKLLKTTETIELNNHYAELEKIAEAVTKIPADEMIAILQDLTYFSDALLEYIYDDDTVIVTSLNFPHDTYESEDDYRHVYSAEDFIAKMTRHLLFHKDVHKGYQQQFIKVMKGLIAVSSHFEDLSWVNESIEQNGLAEGREGHELSEVYRLIKRTPPDLILQIFNDLSFFKGIEFEYNHKDNTVTLKAGDDPRIIRPTEPARDYVRKVSQHLLFRPRSEESRDEFISAIKGMIAMSAHFEDMSWVNESAKQRNLTETQAKDAITAWAFNTFNAAVTADWHGTTFSRVAYFILTVVARTLLFSDKVDLHYMSRYVQLIIGDFNESYRFPHYNDDFNEFTESEQHNYKKFIQAFIEHIPIIADMIYTESKQYLETQTAATVTPMNVIKTINNTLRTEMMPGWIEQISTFNDETDLSWANEAIALRDLTKEKIIGSLSSWLHSNIIATSTMYRLAAIIENIDILSTAIKNPAHFNLVVVYEERRGTLHSLDVIIDKNRYKYAANEIDRFKEDLITNIPVLAARIYDAKFSKINFDSPEGEDKLDRVVRAINYIFSPARYPVEFTLHDLDEDLDWVNESRKGKDYE